jgi:MFS family permease
MTVEFGLYCENKFYRSLTCSCMYMGVFFGNLIIGYLGDFLGRKKVVVGSWFLGSLGVFLLGLNINYSMLLFSMIFIGLTLWPPLNFALILLNE